MSLWNQDEVVRAWNYASCAHKEQSVPGSDIPYINHLGLVAMEAMAAIADDLTDPTDPTNPVIESPSLLVVCALLHDSIEDTHTTRADIEREFGPAVAAGVSALSKDSTLPTKALQMQDSLNRIKAQPKEIWMVKLADRITNLQPPPRHWHPERIDAYRQEARLILAELGSANPYLSRRLALKIVDYGHPG
jgi:(p)ppGpp synthase/HD superfamily hydrolase